MKKALFFLFIGVCGWNVVAAEGNASTATRNRLPGSIPVIQAIHYPSLQSAIDAAPSSGGLVQLPPGRFEIEQPLMIQSEDITLEGAGTATHLHNSNTSGQPALLLQHPEGGTESSQNLWRIRLANLRITGNPESGHGILARRINELFIQGVTVSENGRDGIRLDQCYEDPRISDCLITYNKGTGLSLLGCHDIVVSANQFEENQDAVHCLDGFNLCMTGNNLDDHLGKGVVIENTYGSVISGNMIEECNAAAIVLDRDCYGIALSANVIAHNGAGVDLQDAHGCSVSANTFTILKTDALRIGSRSGRITVTGNNFSNSYIGNDQVRRGENDLAAAGIHLDGTRDIVITGNTFSGLTTSAVTTGTTPSRNILFRNNQMIDTDIDSALIEDWERNKGGAIDK